jgi:hypothetical protein
MKNCTFRGEDRDYHDFLCTPLLDDVNNSVDGVRGRDARVKDVGDIAWRIFRESVVVLNWQRTVLRAVHAWKGKELIPIDMNE